MFRSKGFHPSSNTIIFGCRLYNFTAVYLRRRFIVVPVSQVVQPCLTAGGEYMRTHRLFDLLGYFYPIVYFYWSLLKPKTNYYI